MQFTMFATKRFARRAYWDQMNFCITTVECSNIQKRSYNLNEQSSLEKKTKKKNNWYQNYDAQLT